MFKLPTKSNLKSRISTINNAFVISITPWIKPSEKEIKEYYKKLGFVEGKCCYCGENSTSMDHIHPLVSKGKPTGYITEINNLIPCCSNCNSSKGNKEFEEWYKSEKNIKRLKGKGLEEKEIEKRYKKILKFIKNNKAFKYNAKIIDKKEYQYNKNLNNINSKLKKYEKQNDKLRQKIQSLYNKKGKSKK